MALRDAFLMLVVNLAWGLNFIATKYAVNDLPPIWAAALRFVLVILILCPFLKISKHLLRPVLTIGLVLGVVHFGVFYVATSMQSNVSVVAIGMLMITPFSTLLAIMLLGERIAWKRGLGIIFALSGVLFIAYDPTAFDNPLAFGLVFVSAFGYALASVFMRKIQGVGLFTMQAWVAVCGFVVLFCLSMLVEDNQWPATMNAGDLALGGVAYSGLISTLVGHGGLYYLLQRYPVTLISPLTLLAQVFGVIASVLILNEILSDRIIIGAIITFTGAVVISLRNSAKHQNVLSETLIEEPKTDEAKS